MEIITYIMVVFAVLGGIDRIIGNKFGLGKEFERGIEILSLLTSAMFGILILSPVIANLIKPVLSYLPMEPSLPMGIVFSIDLGGAELAKELATTPELGYFNGIIVATMMGCTISFSIPFALNSVDKQLHKFVFLGFLCGIVTIPIGSFVGLITRLITAFLSFFHSARSTVVSLSTGRPTALNMRFMAILSMPREEPRTPADV